MNIKIIELLEKIINSSGSCNDRTPQDCRACPIGNSKKRTDGSLIGCIESLGIEGLSEDEANKKYFEAAVTVLADIKLEQILGDDDGS
jgi:hypothetical protein